MPVEYCLFVRVSVLFNEPKLLKFEQLLLQIIAALGVSVLFNEPKLLKYVMERKIVVAPPSFSALQRAEIAEMRIRIESPFAFSTFQCSSTSRNC